MLGQEEIDGLRLQLEAFRENDQKKLDLIQVATHFAFCDIMLLT